MPSPHTIVRRSTEGPIEYRLIDATAADEAWLDALRRRAYADLFVATWGGWDEARHRRHFSASVARGHISIVEWEGVRVGMIQRFHHVDHVEVAEVQIDPDHQRRGIGTSLLERVISEATARGLEVRLRVGRANRGAIALYERLGFAAEQVTSTHCHMTYSDRRGS